MDVKDGPISSDDTDISLETQPPPQVSDCSDSPTTNPRPSAEIPPDSASRPPDRGRPYFNSVSLKLVHQTIHSWRLPRHPEYGTLARRTRTFYQDPGPWDAEGRPSVVSIAAAEFCYDGRSKIFNSYISNFTIFLISRSYLNLKLRVSRDTLSLSFIHP